MAMLKGKLLRTFFFIIFSLSFASIGLFVMHFYIVEKYKAISDNIIAEYTLTNTVADLIVSYNSRFRNIDLDEEEENRKVQATKDSMRKTMEFLDTRIESKESQAGYAGLKNTITDVVDEVDKGLEELSRGNVTSASIHYEAANKKYLFVKENGNKLIFHELSYAESVQNEIDNLYQASTIIGGFLLLIAIGGSTIYAFRFSNKVAVPLRKLTKTAEQVASGDMELTLSQELLDRTDEIGRLARSYRVMLTKLASNISELDASNKNLKQVSSSVSAKNAELEKLNEYMINRELKMIELKKEISACKKNGGDSHKEEASS
jgi:nitrogen fixation/metabolism regulation signal transduction histidine kinase